MSDNSNSDTPNNGLQAFTTLGQFLETDEWYPQQVQDEHLYRMGYTGKNGQMTCFARIMVELEQFLFYAIAPVKAPEAARPAVAEFITRANYGMRIGNFEMDFSDGEVRYKSSLDFEQEVLTPRLIKNAIYPVVQTIDRYLPGLMRVIYGDQPPAEAIAEIEGASE
jgi:hypothetical protein